MLLFSFSWRSMVRFRPRFGFLPCSGYRFEERTFCLDIKVEVVGGKALGGELKRTIDGEIDWRPGLFPTLEFVFGQADAQYFLRNSVWRMLNFCGAVGRSR